MCASTSMHTYMHTYMTVPACCWSNVPSKNVKNHRNRRKIRVPQVVLVFLGHVWTCNVCMYACVCVCRFIRADTERQGGSTQACAVRQNCYIDR